MEIMLYQNFAPSQSPRAAYDRNLDPLSRPPHRPLPRGAADSDHGDGAVGACLRGDRAGGEPFARANPSDRDPVAASRGRADPGRPEPPADGPAGAGVAARRARGRGGKAAGDLAAAESAAAAR